MPEELLQHAIAYLREPRDGAGLSLALLAFSSSLCSAASVGSSATGTRYDSAAQAPRSISLQRSEQKGRKRLLSDHSTGLPHCGQATTRARACFTDYKTSGRTRRPLRTPTLDPFPRCQGNEYSVHTCWR